MMYYAERGVGGPDWSIIPMKHNYPGQIGTEKAPFIK